ncbi:MrpH family fimbial adhesin [Providencia stuartii]|uniref:MrpH family fimbial adhesin n=1 Tax=Providencia stuartii TaxID=588 RepID=UPI00332C0F50
MMKKNRLTQILKTIFVGLYFLSSPVFSASLYYNSSSLLWGSAGSVPYYPGATNQFLPMLSDSWIGVSGPIFMGVIGNEEWLDKPCGVEFYYRDQNYYTWRWSDSYVNNNVIAPLGTSWEYAGDYYYRTSTTESCRTVLTSWGETWGTISSGWMKNTSQSSTTSAQASAYAQSVAGKLCLFMKINSNYSNPYQNYQRMGCGGSQTVIPQPTSCALNLSSMTLDHGTLSSSSISGNTSSIDGGITCSQDTKAYLSLLNSSVSGNDYLVDLGGGVTSKISICNSSGLCGNGGLLTVPLFQNNSQNIIIKSVLNSSGVISPNTYTANMVLLMTYE